MKVIPSWSTITMCNDRIKKKYELRCDDILLGDEYKHMDCI